MANYEMNGVFTHVDESGNTYELYPQTKAELIEGTLPIANGGTGATNAAGALSNLGLTATAKELNYCDGVTSNIQTQLNGKSDSGHNHNYAGSSSAGGSATKVESTLLNPTNQGTYAIPFHSQNTGDKTMQNNDGISYRTKEGTASANGYGIVRIGNSVASGAEGNKYGQLDIFATTAARGSILQPDIASDVVHKLPSTGGTLLNNKDFTVSNGVLTLNFL